MEFRWNFFTSLLDMFILFESAVKSRYMFVETSNLLIENYFCLLKKSESFCIKLTTKFKSMAMRQMC